MASRQLRQRLYEACVVSAWWPARMSWLMALLRFPPLIFTMASMAAAARTSSLTV